MFSFFKTILFSILLINFAQAQSNLRTIIIGNGSSIESKIKSVVEDKFEEKNSIKVIKESSNENSKYAIFITLSDFSAGEIEGTAVHALLVKKIVTHSEIVIPNEGTLKDIEEYLKRPVRLIYSDLKVIDKTEEAINSYCFDIVSEIHANHLE